LKLINDRVACSFLIVNLIFIFIGYFGLLDTTGYVNNSLVVSQYIQGTPEEYWKIKIDYYYSIIYIALMVLSYFVILLHKGTTPLSISISRSLKYQILIFIIIDITTRIININHPNELERLSLWWLVVPFIAALLANRKEPSNMKLITISILSCMSVLLLLSLQKNIFKANMDNRIVQATVQYTPVGTPMYKYEPTVIGVKKIDDGIATIERITKNYTEVLSVITYPSINKMSNEDVFEMMDKMSKNYVIKDESYLKEKFGGKFVSTRVYSYNKIGPLNEIDLKLIQTYKTKGIDAAMNELKNIQSSVIKIAIENKQNFDESPKI
jgi:hypothetical protein